MQNIFKICVSQLSFQNAQVAHEKAQRGVRGLLRHTRGGVGVHWQKSGLFCRSLLRVLVGDIPLAKLISDV